MYVLIKPTARPGDTVMACFSVSILAHSTVSSSRSQASQAVSKSWTWLLLVGHVQSSRGRDVCYSGHFGCAFPMRKPKTFSLAPRQRLWEFVHR